VTCGGAVKILYYRDTHLALVQPESLGAMLDSDIVVMNTGAHHKAIEHVEGNVTRLAKQLFLAGV